MGKIVIIGAGMAGFGAAHVLNKNGIESIIFEKNNYHGGHAATFEKDGFVFDDGPHISFTKNERLRKLFHESVNNKVVSFNAHVNNYWKGHWIKHPAPVNLHGLPAELVVKIIRQFFEVTKAGNKEVDNYKDWLYATYGEIFSETFPMEYTKKFHTTTADKLDIDWIGPRLYQPDIEEVLLGALSDQTEHKHYVSDFYYPTTGGFVRFLDQFLEQTNLQLSYKVENIDVENKIISFENGKTEVYENLISSMPLPELIKRIKNIPLDVLEASQKLACSTCICVNIGVNRDNISNANWTYFYDSDIIFTRLTYPHMQSPYNTPEGCGSVQAEIYFSNKYKPLDKNPEEFIEPTISDLIKVGIINNREEVIFKDVIMSQYANVIFDLERIPNLKIVHDYLDNVGIAYCGRFGEWGYHWTDESFISGENAAEKVIRKINNVSEEIVLPQTK